MKNDFLQTQIININLFRLHPHVQKAMEERKYKPNVVVRNIFSNFTFSDTACPEKLHGVLLDFIDTAREIDKYGESFFSYRKEGVPKSVYYTLLASNFIANNPETPLELPEDYLALQAEISNLIKEPEMINSPEINPVAAFCHKMYIYFSLKDYLGSLRKGDLPSEKQMKSGISDLVSPIRHLFGHEDAITLDILETVKKINFILNHHDNDLCNFIKIGMEDGENAFKKDALLSMLPVKPNQSLEHVFDVCYQSFLNRHGELNYDFFYDFSEKIILPVTLFCMTEPDYSQAGLEYMIAYASLCHSENPKTLVTTFGPAIEILHCKLEEADENIGVLLDQHGITGEHLLSMSTCLHITDMSLLSFKISGNHTTPLYDGEEISSLYNTLAVGKEIMVSNPHLKVFLETSRIEAAKFLDGFIRNYPDAAEELGMQPGFL